MHSLKIARYIILALFVLSTLQSCITKHSNEEMSTPDLSPIASTSCGTGDVTVILIHGWNINRGYWESQMNFLCSSYAAVSIDLPGFGDSKFEKTDWTIEEYGSVVSELITKLGCDRVILVGHSMSGDVMLETAILQPEKVIGLIGIDNLKEVNQVYTAEEQAEIDAFLDLLTNDYQDIASAYAEGTLFHSSTDSSVIKRVMNDFKNSNPQVGISTLKDLIDYGPRESDLLKQLKQPLYLINSNTNPTNLESLLSLGVDVHLLEMDRTGHYPMLEKSEEFNELLGEALNKIIK